MTITAFFGQDPITLASSNALEAADSCNIVTATNAVFDCQELPDGSGIQGRAMRTATIDNQEAADGSVLFLVDNFGSVTMAATESADSTRITAIVPTAPQITGGSNTDYTIEVADEDFLIEVP